MLRTYWPDTFTVHTRQSDVIFSADSCKKDIILASLTNKYLALLILLGLYYLCGLVIFWNIMCPSKTQKHFKYIIRIFTNLSYKSFKVLRSFHCNDEKIMLKTVAFIAGKSENQAAQKFFIRFSIDNFKSKHQFVCIKLASI